MSWRAHKRVQEGDLHVLDSWESSLELVHVVKARHSSPKDSGDHCNHNGDQLRVQALKGTSRAQGVGPPGPSPPATATTKSEASLLGARVSRVSTFPLRLKAENGTNKAG